MKNNIKKAFKGPMLLCIVDGFGLRESSDGNAVKLAHTPTLDRCMAQSPHSELVTHGEAVGLPKGQMGNSEVGHMTIGSGRTVLQSLDLVREGLKGDMQAFPNWEISIEQAKKSNQIHLIGMLSDGGVHSHTDHLALLCEKLQTLGKPIIIHAILDGRDTQPQAGSKQVKAFLERVKGLDNVHLADICGRFYAMDRDNNWDRLERAFNLYTQSARNYSECGVVEEIENQYPSVKSDEFIEPTAFKLPNDISSIIEGGDSVFLFNFRADRMRELVHAFIDDEFKGFKRPHKLNVHLTCMTEYDKNFNSFVITLFPPTQPKNTLGEVVASLGGKQLRIAESEKYAHVTFFLNGGLEKPFENEERVVIPSPKVKTYDLEPRMSLSKVTEALENAITAGGFDLIVLNIANGDQVGHSGSLEASIEAVEYIDTCLSKILLSLESADGEMVLIADHGNCEEMLTADGGICTSHTLNPVPFIYVGRRGYKAKNGSLKDVAPTVLYLLGIEKPVQMTGNNLLEKIEG
tara:strand:+ start:171965 stop:173521 length:1557 start_codon:yes stop_codon:yes gene_type:complete